MGAARGAGRTSGTPLPLSDALLIVRHRGGRNRPQEGNHFPVEPPGKTRRRTGRAYRWPHTDSHAALRPAGSVGVSAVAGVGVAGTPAVHSAAPGVIGHSVC